MSPGFAYVCSLPESSTGTECPGEKIESKIIFFSGILTSETISFSQYRAQLQSRI